MNFPYGDGSVAIAYFFTIVFGILLLVQLAQAARHKSLLGILVIWALFLECFGFATRLISIKHSDPLWSVIIYQIGLIIAPTFIVSQVHRIFGRIVCYLGPQPTIIGHRALVTTLLSLDVLVIVLHIVGAAIYGSANGDHIAITTSQWILVTGISIQMIAYGLFMWLAVNYHLRASRTPGLSTYAVKIGRLNKLWAVVYAAGALIMVRNVYRMIQFATISFGPNGDPTGYTATHAWPLYVFDSVPMLVTCILLSLTRPGNYLPEKKGVRIDGTVSDSSDGWSFLGLFSRRPPQSTPGSAHVPLQAAQVA